jgi:hypothetical protein
MQSGYETRYLHVGTPPREARAVSADISREKLYHDKNHQTTGVENTGFIHGNLRSRER